MCTSHQLRQARTLLAWSLRRTSQQTGLPLVVIKRAETGDGAPDITLRELAHLQGALEAAGVRIGHDGTVGLDGGR